MKTFVCALLSFYSIYSILWFKSRLIVKTVFQSSWCFLPPNDILLFLSLSSLYSRLEVLEKSPKWNQPGRKWLNQHFLKGLPFCGRVGQRKREGKRVFAFFILTHSWSERATGNRGRGITRNKIALDTNCDLDALDREERPARDAFSSIHTHRQLVQTLM